MSKGLKNICFGLLAQVLTIGIGILIPRLVIVNLGSEANGLLSSVGNILTYLSLLEAGVGTATLQALYKPCATNDHESANSIMAATNHFYRRTGKVYFLIILALSIAFPLFITTELPRLEVFLVVLLSGLTGVISYFFQGKFRIFLIAEGKNYVNTNIVTLVQIGTSAAKAILLASGFGVVAVSLSAFMFNIIQMALFLVYMKRHYPWLNMNVKPDLDAISQRNAVLVHQISGLIFNNTDVLLLTIFASLKEVSVYSMYAMIYGMVKSLAVVLYESYTYALGQSYNTDKQRFDKIFNAYEVLSIVITFSLYCICRFLMNPFLTLYTAGVHDIRYVDPYLPWLFTAFYLLHNGRISSATIINISQHFEDTKWHSILESCINLGVSVICVIQFGIYGVLIGTIVALLYRTNDMILFASGILKRSCWITYRRWLFNLAVFTGVSWGLEMISIRTSNYINLLGSGIVVSLFVIVIFIISNAIMEKDSAAFILSIVRKRLNGVINKKTRS